MMKMEKSEGLCGIYALYHGLEITSQAATRLQYLFKQGLTVVQYRQKEGSFKERKIVALQLKKMCDDHGAYLLINDDVHLAIEIDADGVHVGREDMAVADARALLGPEKIIGATCHDQISFAHEAIQHSADYCAFGAFFPTTTKTATRAPLSILKTAASLPCKIAAIGGINATNIQQVLEYHPHMIAMTQALFANTRTDTISHIFHLWNEHHALANNSAIPSSF